MNQPIRYMLEGYEGRRGTNTKQRRTISVSDVVVETDLAVLVVAVLVTEVGREDGEAVFVAELEVLAGGMERHDSSGS